MTTECKLRVVYRESSGTIHLDWTPSRLGEALKDRTGLVWLDIEDPDPSTNGNAEKILGDVFGFHPLAIEDALKETHVPKVDDWGDYLYIVFQSIDFSPGADVLRLLELDIFLGGNYLVTYHTHPLSFLDQDRRNIERDAANRMRHGADHLLYHLLDLAVAEYLPAIERLDQAIDEAQEEVFGSPTPDTLHSIFRVKRSALRLYRTIGPEREVLNRLARDSYPQIAEDHRVYFRDVYDHLVRVHDLIESLRDLISGALDTYLSAISNRTNDIMKRLTLVTVMFLPMTFLTGFFGMNYFGETLAFHSPLPRGLLFIGTCLIMVTSLVGQWFWASRRGWL
ncbi:MAG: magnesium/cobalt transporter CorA [Isosphaeraceae bacterium]